MRNQMAIAWDSDSDTDDSDDDWRSSGDEFDDPVGDEQEVEPLVDVAEEPVDVAAVPPLWREHASELPKDDLQSTVTNLREALSENSRREHGGERMDSHQRGMLAVGERLLEQGAMRMTDAVAVYCGASGFQPPNSSKFPERLRRYLPVVTFTSTSRKHGWMVMEHTDNVKGILHRMLRVLAAKETQVQRLVEKELTRQEFQQLEEVMTAEEKVLMRYLLVRIYSGAEAERRFGISNGSAIRSKVTAALQKRAAERASVTAPIAAKRARTLLQSPAKGGRVPWEKDPTTKAAFLSAIEKVRARDGGAVSDE
jgi:hypothetical protein